MPYLRQDLPYEPVPFTGERWPWKGGDLQTIRNSIFPDAPVFSSYEDEIFELPDGDKILGAFHRHKDARALLIIIHGLAGDYNSSYIAHLTAQAKAQNYHILRVNLRGAGKGRPLAKSAYHAGRAEDLRHVIEVMAKKYPQLPLFMAAFSLGGTMAVNLVARHPVHQHLSGLVTFCAPLDMVSCSAKFHQPRNHLYVRHFTKALRQQAGAGPSAVPDILPRLKSIKTVREFDDIFTAPQAGYRDAEDYYKGTTPLAYLDRIKTPTLLVHSDNDPWIDVESYLKIKKTDRLFCVITKGGGHVGFHDKNRPHRCWQTAICLEYFGYLLQRV